MRFWLNSYLFFTAIALFFSCSNSNTTKEVAESDLQDIDSLNIQANSDFESAKIDSSNHTNFLTKEGYYTATWDLLQDVVIDLKYYPEYNSKGYFAVFGTSPLFLENKKVEVEGYVIPLVLDSASNETRFILSFYPNSSCFFCGGGGPETVIDLKLKPKHRKYREDEYLKFRGILRLNANNPWEMNYLLDEAVAVE